MTKSPCSAVIKDFSHLKEEVDTGTCYYIGDNLVKDQNAFRFLGKKES